MTIVARDQQRAADREALNQAFVDSPEVLTGDTAYVLAEAALPVVAAARAEESARREALRERIEEAFHHGHPRTEEDWRAFARRVRAALEADDQ